MHDTAAIHDQFMLGTGALTPQRAKPNVHQKTFFFGMHIQPTLDQYILPRWAANTEWRVPVATQKRQGLARKSKNEGFT